MNSAAGAASWRKKQCDRGRLALVSTRAALLLSSAILMGGDWALCLQRES